jgi:hypothetical protein
MLEAGMSTPEIIGDQFDLETLDASTRGRGIALEDAGFVWNHGEGLRHRAFDDIAVIDLEVLIGDDGTFARCAIRFLDGTHLTVRINTDKIDAIMSYREFVLLFLERLGSVRRARIIFREGVSPARRMATIIAGAVGLVSCLAMIVFALLSPQLLKEDNSWLLLPLMLLFAALCAGVLWAGWHSGRKIFDPAAIPDRALPPALRQRPA